MGINESELNAWLADKCKISVYAGSSCWGEEDYDSSHLLYINHDQHEELSDIELWNYKDPRCREIIREHFRICTSPVHPKMFYARAFKAPETQIINCTRAKTISEAECKCIEAICLTHNKRNER